ncbi:hypothetical protein KKI17_01785 [Patescibacteria group bacterium]|nr:hypothetical protein [Patescibacteria group bacterium]
MEKIAARTYKLIYRGAIPVVMLFSLEFGMGMATGYFAGKLLAGSGVDVRGRAPSLTLRIKNYKVHIHHWFHSLFILLCALGLNFYIFNPSIFYGFLGGAVFQGVLGYSDWYRFIQKTGS